MSSFRSSTPRQVSLLVFLVFQIISASLQHNLIASTVQEDSLAILHFRKGEACVLQGDTTRAIKEFEEAVRKDWKYASAYHRLAQLHLSLGSLDDRYKARRYLNEALRFEPKNIAYLHTQLEIYMLIRFYWTAERVAKKIIGIDPKDAKAYFILGTLSENKWSKYRDMTNPTSGVDLSGFVDKDLKKALEYYRQALETNPRFSDCYYRLAFLCFESGLFNRMADLLHEALDIDPENKDYHLFMGLAYQKMRRFQDAWSEYEQAKSLMKPEELALFESIDLICTPEEAKIFRLMSWEIKEQIQYRFWKERDPLFLTEMNERKMEHYGRIAYANMRFSNVLQGIEGWKTDPGNVYIRYGRPLSTRKMWPSIDFTINTNDTSVVAYAADLPINFSKAYWSYSGFFIELEDRNLDGRYEFYIPYVEEKKPNKNFYLIVEEQPEMYEYTSPAKQFIISCRSAGFREEDNQTILEVYQSIPYSIERAIEERQMLPLKRGVFLFDQDWNEVKKEVVDGPFLTSLQNTLSVGWSRLDVPPGDYHLVVEYFDETDGRLGRWQKEVTVEPFDDRTLSMSDVVFAWEIGEYKEDGELRRGGLRIVPNTLDLYPVSSAIPLYFEIYNLTYSIEGSTRYKLTYTVQSEEKKVGVSGFVSRLFGGGKQSGKVVTSYEYSGDRRSEKFYQDLNLEGAEAKEYLIRVEVKDLNTGEKVVREKTVVLKESEEKS